MPFAIVGTPYQNDFSSLLGTGTLAGLSQTPTGSPPSNLFPYYLQGGPYGNQGNSLQQLLAAMGVPASQQGTPIPAGLYNTNTAVNAAANAPAPAPTAAAPTTQSSALPWMQPTIDPADAIAYLQMGGQIQPQWWGQQFLVMPNNGGSYVLPSNYNIAATTPPAGYTGGGGSPELTGVLQAYNQAAAQAGGIGGTSLGGNTSVVPAGGPATGATPTTGPAPAVQA